MKKLQGANEVGSRPAEGHKRGGRAWRSRRVNGCVWGGQDHAAQHSAAEEFEGMNQEDSGFDSM